MFGDSIPSPAVLETLTRQNKPGWSNASPAPAEARQLSPIRILRKRRQSDDLGFDQCALQAQLLGWSYSVRTEELEGLRSRATARLTQPMRYDPTTDRYVEVTSKTSVSLSQNIPDNLRRLQKGSAAYLLLSEGLEQHWTCGAWICYAASRIKAVTYCREISCSNRYP